MGLCRTSTDKPETIEALKDNIREAIDIDIGPIV